jgi:hypothetical protein
LAAPLTRSTELHGWQVVLSARLDGKNSLCAQPARFAHNGLTEFESFHPTTGVSPIFADIVGVTGSIPVALPANGGPFQCVLSLLVSGRDRRADFGSQSHRRKFRSWRRKGVVPIVSPRSCRCWMRAAFERCKCEDRNQGWARPSRSNCSDHSAGASRKVVMPMPRGSRPSTAALTRAGAMNAIDMVMLT